MRTFEPFSRALPDSAAGQWNHYANHHRTLEENSRQWLGRVWNLRQRRRTDGQCRLEGGLGHGGGASASVGAGPGWSGALSALAEPPRQRDHSEKTAKGRSV